MVSLEPLQSTPDCLEPGRISFSSEFLDESNFISICPNPEAEREREAERARSARSAEFEFLSGNLNLTNMMTADELFREGKLLPFRQIHHADQKLNRVILKSDDGGDEGCEIQPTNKEESRMNWFLDDDPSPRPPKCTVLWKELLKLKKQRPTGLSPSSSSSSSSSLADVQTTDEGKEAARSKEKGVKRIKKGQERTSRSTSIRIRPVLTVPICTQAKNNVLPPLFSLKKGRLDHVK